MNSTLGYFPSLEQLAGDAQLVLVHEGNVLVGKKGFLWSTSTLGTIGLSELSMLLIGQFNERTCLVCAVEQMPDIPEIESVSPRQLLSRHTLDEFTIVGQATQLVNWERTHRFCGSCGYRTMPHANERALVCPNCQLHFYPRINPCVIMLVCRDSQMLLARHARTGSAYFSCLAGFMEIGETPEQAVAREVREEVGIEIENIRYIESQSWPFPSQLMLGFFADYKSGELQIDHDEIAEAGWFNAESLPTIPAAGISVAGRLIELFLRRCATTEFTHC